MAASYGVGLFAWRNTSTGFHRFGTACRGNLAARPRLVATGTARVGTQDFAIGVDGAPIATPVFVELGGSRSRFAGLPILPFSFGAFGAPACTQYVSPDVVLFVVTGGTGQGLIPLTLRGPRLANAVFYAQAAVYAPGANALDIVTTEGGGVRIAPR